MHNFYMLTGGNNYGTYTNPIPNPSNANANPSDLNPNRNPSNHGRILKRNLRVINKTVLLV